MVQGDGVRAGSAPVSGPHALHSVCFPRKRLSSTCVSGLLWKYSCIASCPRQLLKPIPAPFTCSNSCPVPLACSPQASLHRVGVACCSMAPAPSHPTPASPQAVPLAFGPPYHTLPYPTPTRAANPTAGQRAFLFLSCLLPAALAVVFLPVFCTKGLNSGTRPQGTDGHGWGLQWRRHGMGVPLNTAAVAR